ncbi:cryptochrome/photolyase family protein [Flavobacterium sp.]
MQKNNPSTLRLVLGDQLNYGHSWFASVDNSVQYVMMEVRTETDYVWHHIQKVVGFFTAMRNFADWLGSQGHNVVYIKISDNYNLQSFEANLSALISERNITNFEYLLPDEYRVDRLLKDFAATLSITNAVFDTEHFFTTRDELGNFFEGKKSYLMESFYQAMRKKHGILVTEGKPIGGQWNFDSENRKKLPKGHSAPTPLVFENDVTELLAEILPYDIVTIGTVDAKNFIWPVNRKQSLELLDFFIENGLPLFGTFQDAMAPGEWSLYHSRLSFAMNTKMISPKEVIHAAIEKWEESPEAIALNQLEGFVRQILGWREYMRGIYWLKMPEFATLNFFDNKLKLPDWYWTGKTKMNCLKDAISQSLNFAYAHHIQRLMITGNFALLAGIAPNEVDQWYLGIYIDALEWVEITNTRGMSQFADGGIIGTKPYVSSAAYIDKMSHYCGTCFYDKSRKVGPKACPFNSLYWNFYDKHESKLSKNPRIGMMYKIWQKMKPDEKAALLEQADFYIRNIDTL